MTVPGTVPPQNVELETFVLGAPLIGADGGQLVSTLSGEEGLRPEHFYRESHGQVFTAMLTLVDRHEPVDVATVTEQLAAAGTLDHVGGTPFVHSLPAVVPSAGNAPYYARRVVELAHLRDIIRVGRDLVTAAFAGDHDAIAEAEGRLARRDTRRRAKTRDQRVEDLVGYIERREAAPWRWPFPALNGMTGGLWRGHFTVLIGHSQHGKSVFADQILEDCADAGARCGAYLTEMTEMERDMRFVARAGDLPFKRLRDANLDPTHMPAFAATVQRLPFDIELVGARTAQDLARDIRRQGWDVCVIDLLNVVTGRETKDIDANIGMFASLATETGTHIIGCQHLNRSGFSAQQTYPPEPTIGQIRGSGAIHDLATNVLSVHRKETEDRFGELTGEPGPDAQIRFLKLKNGTVGAMSALFNGNRMRFEAEAAPPPAPGTVGSVAV